MSVTVRRLGQRAWIGPAMLSFWLGAVAPVHAESWQVDRGAELRAEANDNPALSVTRAQASHSVVLVGSVNASRSSESSASSAALNLAGTQELAGSGRAAGRLEGSLLLGQSINDPVDGIDLGLRFQNNSTLDTLLAGATSTSSDLLLGRGDQRSWLLNASWSHRLDERWSTRLSGSEGATDYASGLIGALPFHNRTLGASLQRQIDERVGLSLSLNHSRFAPQGAGNDSATNDLSLGYSRAMSPTGSLSLSGGIYRTRSETSQFAIVCPQAIELCLAGLVPFERLRQNGSRTRQGQQASLGWSERVDERSEAAVSAARALSPSGTGAVVRSDTLTLRLSRSWSETLSGNANLSASRSRYDGVADAPRPQLQSLALALSKALAPDASLQASWQHSRASDARVGSVAHGNRFSVSLRLDGLRLSGSSR